MSKDNKYDITSVFHASESWYSGFANRYKLKIRQTTNDKQSTSNVVTASNSLIDVKFDNDLNTDRPTDPKMFNTNSEFSSMESSIQDIDSINDSNPSVKKEIVSNDFVCIQSMDCKEFDAHFNSTYSNNDIYRPTDYKEFNDDFSSKGLNITDDNDIIIKSTVKKEIDSDCICNKPTDSVGLDTDFNSNSTKSNNQNIDRPEDCKEFNTDYCSTHLYKKDIDRDNDLNSSVKEEIVSGFVSTQTESQIECESVEDNDGKQIDGVEISNSLLNTEIISTQSNNQNVNIDKINDSNSSVKLEIDSDLVSTQLSSHTDCELFKTYECKTCGVNCTSSGTLVKHIKSHTGENIPKRCSYDRSFKLNVVAFAEENGNRAAGRHFNVSESNVRNWCRDKSLIETLPVNKRTHRRGETRFKHLEKDLFEWVTEKRNNGCTISRIQIRKHALQMSKDKKYNITSMFCASHSWCTRFINSYGLTIRQTAKEKNGDTELISIPVVNSEFISRPLNNHSIDKINDLNSSVEKEVDNDFIYIQPDSVDDSESLKEYRCKTCGLNCESSLDLVKHVKTHTTGEKIRLVDKIVENPKRCSYDCRFKLTVVAYAEENGNRAAERHFTVPESNIRNWRQNKSKLETLPKTKRCQRYRETPFKLLEKDLIEWITEKRKSGSTNVSRMEICKRALKMSKEKNYNFTSVFYATVNWCTRFINRYGLKIPTKFDKKRCRVSISKPLVLENKNLNTDVDSTESNNQNTIRVNGSNSTIKKETGDTDGDFGLEEYECTICGVKCDSNDDLVMIHTGQKTKLFDENESIPKRCTYDCSFKLAVVNYAEKYGNSAAEKHFNVSECNIRIWRPKKTKFEAMPKTKHVQRYCDTPVKLLEKDLLQWVTEKRKNGCTISRMEIHKRAMEMSKDKRYNITSLFRASVGWCTRFMQKYEIDFGLRDT